MFLRYRAVVRAANSLLADAEYTMGHWVEPPAQLADKGTVVGLEPASATSSIYVDVKEIIHSKSCDISHTCARK